MPVLGPYSFKYQEFRFIFPDEPPNHDSYDNSPMNWMLKNHLLTLLSELSGMKVKQVD